MGIFDRFKKQDGENSNSQNLDLSNPVIKKMVDWIEHPMEFGKKPDTISIIDQRQLFWPTQKNEMCYLLKYTIDGKEYIGFTGPITWSFFDIDFNQLSFEDLYIRYTGWFIVFYTINSENYDKKNEGTNEARVRDGLHKMGLSEITKIQNAFIGGNNYYEFLADEGGQKLKVVGIEGDMQELTTSHILPFFEYVGIGWDPLSV